MSKEAMILKSDGAGRVQTPVERQVALVREFERSGLSGPRFAAVAGVKYQTFVTWRRKHGSGSTSRARVQAPQVTLVEAVAAAGNEDDSVMAIELPGNGVRRHESLETQVFTSQFQGKSEFGKMGVP